MNTNSANSLMNDTPVYDITPFTHLDFPGHLAAIIWFYGCNMRCAYCYNDTIVMASKGRYGWDEVMEFFLSRKDLLEGAVLSGGEATRHDLMRYTEDLRTLGYKIKLDTNGSNPQLLQRLIQEKRVDYVALDYKAPKEIFSKVTATHLHKKVQDSLQILLQSNIAFEVRTTVHADITNEDQINNLIAELLQLGYNNTLYLQKFRQTDSNIAGVTQPTKSFDPLALRDDLPIIWR